MNQIKSTGQLFEDLVSRIITINHFKIKHVFNGDEGFDLLADFGGTFWAIEIKYYRTVRAQYSLIDRAASCLANNCITAQIKKGMLIVSCILSPELRETLEQTFSITFVDQTDLRVWCSPYPELADELTALLDGYPSKLMIEQSIRDQSSIIKDTITNIKLVEHIDMKGTELCQELQDIKKGKMSWIKYEKTCEKVLNYLFPNDLSGWYSQKRTDDGLNRYDYICRVKPTTEFWKFVIDHLDSRYVLFEFKNYTGKIKQGQVLTTEKYLLEKGLRRVAIIMTRAGADKNAVATTQGAMREHGKLMLIINDQKICKMLKMKERGEDPSDYLFEITDNFLLTLPR